jgi:putative membrane protein
MNGNDLPVVNATLNGTATVLLLLGFTAIKTGRVKLHKSIMLSALAVSAVFLASYLYYHFAVRSGHETHYAGEWRTAYLLLLFSHVGLAPVATLLALYTAQLGLRGRFARHRKFAKWTFPIWLYVSVTGVVVYLFLKDYYPKS